MKHPWREDMTQKCPTCHGQKEVRSNVDDVEFILACPLCNGGDRAEWELFFGSGAERPSGLTPEERADGVVGYLRGNHLADWLLENVRQMVRPAGERAKLAACP
jgi:hypothetical protein